MVALPGDVLFDFDKAMIRPSARATLDKVVQLISSRGDVPVAIEGHTDSKGDDDYNLRLSRKRAEAVRAYLVSKSIADDRLTVRGLGESKLKVPDHGSDEADMQKNRRVEVIIGDE